MCQLKFLCDWFRWNGWQSNRVLNSHGALSAKKWKKWRKNTFRKTEMRRLFRCGQYVYKYVPVELFLFIPVPQTVPIVIPVQRSDSRSLDFYRKLFSSEIMSWNVNILKYVSKFYCVFARIFSLIRLAFGK